MVCSDSVESDAPTPEHPVALGEIGFFGERLKGVMGNIGARAFARSCGLSEGAIRSYLSGDTFPTLDRLAQIAQAAGVDPLWLAFGKAPATTPDDEDEGVYAYVPLYDAWCSGGHGAWNEQAKVLTRLAFTRYSLRKKGLTPSDLACLRVDGDSMSGLMEDGDTVMIDLSRATLEAEGVYVIRLDNRLYAKRLQRQLDGVLIISHNKDYQQITVPQARLAELEIVGRVIWSGGWLV
ncbi:S24 family peptidase [Pseudomonas solani]|uniref:S24 family peptidase n=1 Tax=Pseudomonas solani TaxID=2731552 RepID=A0AAU7Y5F9_9PSED